MWQDEPDELQLLPLPPRPAEAEGQLHLLAYQFPRVFHKTAAVSILRFGGMNFATEVSFGDAMMGHLQRLFVPPAVPGVVFRCSRCDRILSSLCDFNWHITQFPCPLEAFELDYEYLGGRRGVGVPIAHFIDKLVIEEVFPNTDWGGVRYDLLDPTTVPYPHSQHLFEGGRIEKQKERHILSRTTTPICIASMVVKKQRYILSGGGRPDHLVTNVPECLFLPFLKPLGSWPQDASDALVPYRARVIDMRVPSQQKAKNRE
jgi:hypothetical protein